MVVVGLVISTLLLLACWLWVFTHVFAGHETKQFRRGLLWWGVGALLLVGLATYYKQQGIDIYDTNIVTPVALTLFLIVRSVLTWPVRHKVLLLAVFLTIILLGSYLTWSSLIASSLIAVILAATLEEAIKFFAGFKNFTPAKDLVSDLLMRCMLSALGFALVENIVYLIQGVSTLFGAQQQLILWTKIIFIRSLFGSRVHMLFVALLARGVMQQYKTHQRRRGAVGIFLGVTLHTLYNLSLQSASAIVLLSVLIVGYFVFSRLLFQTDRLYITGKSVAPLTF